jgi:hypothetical protein
MHSPLVEPVLNGKEVGLEFAVNPDVCERNIEYVVPSLRNNFSAK